ncbi:MAG: ABC transporter permease [Spirochaetaceae bacterium]|jgi:lipoprotein-releasing system permease protein|nr:ABC transporter permease [Spirochaetaceae bacterium]
MKALFKAPLLFVAMRYLLGRSKKGSRYLLGAAAGIALSLIPIIVTLIVADGMIRGITDRFMELGTGHLQIWPYRNDVLFDSRLELAKEKVSKIKEVLGVWEEKQGLGIIVTAKGKAGTTIRALDPMSWEDSGSEKYLTVISGDSGIQNEDDVLLGEALAKSVGAEVGKTLRIMTIRTNEDGKNIPRLKVYKVRGIVSSGYHDLDSMWCIINLEAGEKLFQDNNCYTFLTVKIDDPYNSADYVKAKIDFELNGKFGIYTWKELQQSQYKSYESTRQMLILIMALIVLVASVNVSSATSMLVIERQRDIAVLKSFGVYPAETRKIFLWASFLTGITGAAAGITAGLFVGYNINQIIHMLENFINFWTKLFNGSHVRILDPDFYLETIPIVVDTKTVFFIAVFTVICSLVASLFPSIRAGRTKPIELLRKY